MQKNHIQTPYKLHIDYISYKRHKTSFEINTLDINRNILHMNCKWHAATVGYKNKNVFNQAPDMKQNRLAWCYQWKPDSQTRWPLITTGWKNWWPEHFIELKMIAQKPSHKGLVWMLSSGWFSLYLALFNRCLVALFAFLLGDKQLNMNIFKGKRGQKRAKEAWLH